MLPVRMSYLPPSRFLSLAFSFVRYITGSRQHERRKRCKGRRGAGQGGVLMSVSWGCGRRGGCSFMFPCVTRFGEEGTNGVGGLLFSSIIAIGFTEDGVEGLGSLPLVRCS